MTSGAGRTAGRRVVGIVVAGYLAAALATRAVEAAGLSRCRCSPDCWCRRPVLSAFRWVVPVGHG